jgi:DNA-binding IscR family transcriptional regulator
MNENICNCIDCDGCYPEGNYCPWCKGECKIKKSLEEVKQQIEQILKNNNYLLMAEGEHVRLVEIRPGGMIMTYIDKDVLILEEVD